MVFTLCRPLASPAAGNLFETLFKMFVFIKYLCRRYKLRPTNELLVLSSLVSQLPHNCRRPRYHQHIHVCILKNLIRKRSAETRAYALKSDPATILPNQRLEFESVFGHLQAWWIFLRRPGDVSFV